MMKPHNEKLKTCIGIDVCKATVVLVVCKAIIS